MFSVDELGARLPPFGHTMLGIIRNTRGSKLLAAAGSDPQGRREAEDLEGKRWNYSLAECLKELDLPRSLFALESRGPMKFLERAAGKLRPKTIRLRLRTFIKYQCWLGLANGVNFPTSIVQVTDYVEERFGRTLPEDCSAIST